MSWPADGLPRFIVGSEPKADAGRGGDRRAAGYVADRGYCHRRVHVIQERVEGVARSRAEDAAAILNAGGTL